MTSIRVESAKRARRCHYTFGFNNKGKKGILPNERHLVIDNDSIKYPIIENTNNLDAIKMLERLLKELRKPVDIPKKGIIWERPMDYLGDSECHFTADDIPF